MKKTLGQLMNDPSVVINEMMGLSLERTAELLKAMADAVNKRMFELKEKVESLTDSVDEEGVIDLEEIMPLAKSWGTDFNSIKTLFADIEYKSETELLFITVTLLSMKRKAMEGIPDNVLKLLHNAGLAQNAKDNGGEAECVITVHKASPDDFEITDDGVEICLPTKISISNCAARFFSRNKEYILIPAEELIDHVAIKKLVSVFTDEKYSSHGEAFYVKLNDREVVCVPVYNENGNDFLVKDCDGDFHTTSSKSSMMLVVDYDEAKREWKHFENRYNGNKYIELGKFTGFCEIRNTNRGIVLGNDEAHVIKKD